MLKIVFDLKDIKDGAIEKIGSKEIYNTDEVLSLSEWLKENIAKRGGSHDYVKLTSGVKVKETGGTGTILPNSLGYLYNKSNCTEQNATCVALFSTAFSDGHGASIQPQNLDRAYMTFSARKLISSSWESGKDEYLAPNTSHEKYSEFSYDSLIYGTFHSGSNQSSLRDVKYRGAIKDVKNELFFMSKQKMQSLADKHSNQECYNDARHDEDRFVAKTILAIESNKYDGVGFSSEAQLVLNLARELVEDTFKYRVDFNKVQPEYQINNWDCGWYQVKGLLKWIEDNKLSEPISEKYGEFKQAYKALGDKMRPMVYELGFLKK